MWRWIDRLRFCTAISERDDIIAADYAVRGACRSDDDIRVNQPIIKILERHSGRGEPVGQGMRLFQGTVRDEYGLDLVLL